MPVNIVPRLESLRHGKLLMAHNPGDQSDGTVIAVEELPNLRLPALAGAECWFSRTQSIS